MSKVKTIQKAQLPKICGRCSHEIQKGESYRWFQQFRRARQFRCMLSNCTPRLSELTGNDKLSRIYGAQESLQDDIQIFEKDKTVEGLETLRSAVEAAANEAEEVGTEYAESVSNMEQYFEGSQQLDDMREKQEICEEWMGLLKSLELEDFPDIDEMTEDPDNDTKFKVQVEDWASEIVSSVEAAMAELAI